MSSEFIAKIVFLYIEGIFFYALLVFADTSWASALIAVIMILHVFNCIYIWCSISLMSVELGWVDGDGCGWGCGDWVTFVSNFPIRLSLSSRAMVLRLEPSMLDF